MELSYGLKSRQNQIAKLGNKVEVISEMRKLINEQFDQAIEKYLLEIRKWIYDWRRSKNAWIKFRNTDTIVYYVKKSNIKYSRKDNRYTFTAYWFRGDIRNVKKFSVDLEDMYAYIVDPAYEMSDLDSSHEILKLL